ncbi:putative cytochrome P450 [Podospora conica]|nr:putative cytochrome P450 [Schizothecium conicum]
MALLTILSYSVLASFGVWILSCGIPLIRNYGRARRMGIPIRVIPIDHLNPFWTLTDKQLLPLLRRLPFVAGSSFSRYNFRCWEVHDRYRSHHELGDAFVVVTPGNNWLYINDPDAMMDLFRRRHDFPRPLQLTEILNVFGPNLGTVDGAKWKVQRKLTATCFNERNNDIVWSESTTLAQVMVKHWSSKGEIATVAPDTRQLSLNVLSRAGFGKSFPFTTQDDTQPAESQAFDPGSASYRDTLQLIMENCILIMALGPQFLRRWKSWLPRKLKTLAEACISFQGYMTDIYEEEKRACIQPPSASSATRETTFITSLVRASRDETIRSSGAGLTEQEIYGNMFMLNFAGHDTTAHTFVFALYFLAAHRDAQEWVAEELDGLDDGDGERDYRRDFPRLKRCLAVMYESLRLYAPVSISKWNPPEGRPQELVVGGKTVVIPPRTLIIPAWASVQTDPRFWGEDALQWRPQRWVKETAEGGEEWVEARPGTFLSWSHGVRDCPGRKFSQVEFVATLAVLLKEWWIDPVVQEGEDLDGARARVLKLIETDSGAILLLQMLHPERAPLVLKRREKK